MISILTCIGARHNPWLVALAVLVCCVGAQAALSLARRAMAERGGLQLAWIFFAAVVFGTTAWTGHFVAVLAYVADAPALFDTGLTAGSLLIALGGSCVALCIATHCSFRLAPALGGGLLGAIDAAMHYTGMLAMRFGGIVRWNGGRIALSVALASAFGALAFTALHGQLGPRKGVRAAPLLLVAAMISLHTAGMTAMEIVPLSVPRLAFGGSANVLAVAIAAVAGLIVLAGSFVALIDTYNRRDAAERIAELGLVDRTTGLPNRAAFRAEVRARCASGSSGDRFGIIAMEIANLAAISDEFGARIAELAVQATSNRLLQARKPGVFLARTAEARYCGVGIVADRQEVLLRATRLQASLSQDLLIEGTEIAVDVRVGGVVFPDDAADAELLFGKTQAVLARAVADPLHPVTVPDEAAEACARRKLAIATALRGALDRGEFELHYQPQVRIADGVVIGYEALLRWHHPVLGTVPPAEFIPAAEDNGRILPIGAWILLTACQEAITWPAGMRVAVNMSALQLRQSDMPQQVAEALAASGLAPDRLEIELTESLLMEDRAAAHGVLRQIKALGARLALDDFGTGYSSMDVLRIGLFDKIKLDKSFVADIETAPQARAILHAMLALGRELAMPMLAEGVETEEQLAILRREGCVTVQGYLTGRPVPASALGGG